MTMTLGPIDVLLIIDLQNDFCPGGPLPVSDAHAIVPLINALAVRFPHQQPYETIQAPYGPQTLWPEHCLQQTPGAQLHPALDVPQAELILRKGFRPHIDSYSAFLENDHTTPTGLAGYLRERNLTRLFLCGLAYDFCVRFSALDGKRLGFETIVIEDACRAVNLPNFTGLFGSVEATNTSLAAANIPRIQSTEILTL